jgi:oligosaccharide repeat unit polymerase
VSSELRYLNKVNSPSLIYSLLFYSFFISAAFSGILYALRRSSSDFYYSLLPFVPIFVSALIKTQRGTIFFTAIVWLSFYISTSLLPGRENVKISLKNIVTVVFTLIFLYIVLQYFRENGEVSFDNLIRTLNSALFGSVPAFSIWFDSSSNSPISYGEFTFNRIAHYLFDVPQRSPGMYGDVTWLGGSYRDGTTIYTVFRALIQDFGLFIAFVFYGVFSIISGYSYKMVVKGNVSYIPLLAMFIAFNFIGYLASPFSWNGIVLTFLLFLIFFISPHIIHQFKKVMT